MTYILVVFAVGLAVGFAVGYAVRAAISLRHRRAAMKRRSFRPDLGGRLLHRARSSQRRKLIVWTNLTISLGPCVFVVSLCLIANFTARLGQINTAFETDARLIQSVNDW
jgi:hypothetical protein